MMQPPQSTMTMMPSTVTAIMMKTATAMMTTAIED
jgi:hypothetical protein